MSQVNNKSSQTSVQSRTSNTDDSWLERRFKISQRGSTVAREVRGGLVTFFAMAYIIALNPLIIGTATDKDGLLISGAPKFTDTAMTQVDNLAVGASIGMVAAGTALVAGIMTVLMGFFGRFPIGVAAGLGLNALVAYTLAPMMTWPQAMGLVVWEGIITTLLVLTGFRTAVFKAVPASIRTAISVGIGLFIAFVGLINAGIIRKPEGAPPVELGVGGSLDGWPILVFIIGLLLLVALYVRKVRGAMLISILVATALAIVIEWVGKIGSSAGGDNPTGWELNVPELGSFALPDLSLLGRVDMIGAFFNDGKFSWINFITLLILVFSLLLADFFDTMGTVVAVGTEGGLLNDEGLPEHLDGILLVDSLGAVTGGLAGVSSNTSFVESTTGVGEGARTGLASIVTGVAFLLAVVLAPVINMVPSEAASPVLVFVGFLMLSQVAGIEWNKLEFGIPAFLTIIMMPFSYSISTGIGFGFISYVFISVVLRRSKKTHPLMYVVAGVFVIYFLQAPLIQLIS